MKPTKEKLSVNLRTAHKYRRIHAVLLKNPRYTLQRLEISNSMLILFVYNLKLAQNKKNTLRMSKLEGTQYQITICRFIQSDFKTFNVVATFSYSLKCLLSITTCRID